MHIKYLIGLMTIAAICLANGVQATAESKMYWMNEGEELHPSGNGTI